MHTSSLSQDDSLIRENLTSHLDKYSSLRDVYSQSSYIQDSTYDHTNIKSHQSNLQGSQDRRDSQYSPHDLPHQNSSDNLTPPHNSGGVRPVQPFLESVPERSIEHSDATYKTSLIDTDIGRGKYDYYSLHSGKGHRTLPSSSSNYNYDSKREAPESKRESKYKTVGNTFDVKAGDSERNFYSPRFQVENVDSKRSKSKDYANPRSPKEQVREHSYEDVVHSRRQHTLEESSKDLDRFGMQEKPKTGFVQTFERKRFDDFDALEKKHSETFDRSKSSYMLSKRFDDLDRQKSYGQSFDKTSSETFDKKHIDENLFSISKNSYYGPSGASSISSTVRKPDTLGTKVPSRIHQTMSDSELDVNERYAEKRLNYSGAPMFSKTESSFFRKEGSELVDLLNRERIKSEKLEERLQIREGLLEQMKQLYDELLVSYQEVKEDLERTVYENQNLTNANTLCSDENEHLKLKINQLESRVNQVAYQSQDSKQRRIDYLETENQKLKGDLSILSKKYEAKVDGLSSRVKKLEREKEELHIDRQEMEQRLEVVTRNRDVDDDQVNSHVRSLTLQNEELLNRIETMKRLNEEKDRTYMLKLDESIHNSRKLIEERAEAARAEIHEKTKDKLRLYKQKISNLEAENDSLRMQLGSKVEELRSQTRELRKTSNEGGMSKRLMNDLLGELDADDVSEILPKLKRIQHDSQSNAKFVEKVSDLVSACHAPGHFKGGPTLKQSWHWIRRLMEEYMSMKKHGSPKASDNSWEILRSVMDYLNVGKGEVLSRLKQVLSDNILMNKIIKKVKVIQNLEWVAGLSDLDRRLEQEMDAKYDDPYHKLKYYKLNNN